MLSIDEVQRIFTQAKYGVTHVQQVDDQYHVTVTHLRAPKAVNRHPHFEGTGLQLLRWGTDDRQQEWVFVVRECPTSTPR